MKSYKQLWLGTLGATLFVPQMVLADISGTVFRDFNANGSLDSGTITDAGIAGVTVKAFNAAGAQVGATATSDASGHYALTGLTTGADYRVEFAWTQQWLKPSAAGGTAVQFVKDGATANFALHNPNEHNTTLPYLSIPQYINGDSQASATIAARPGLFVFPFNATSPDEITQTPAPIAKATIGQIGAAWGTAFQRSTKTLYTSAVVRRFVGFGPLGIGGIYKVDMTDPTAASTGSLNYIDVKSIGIPVGNSPRDGNACNALATSIDQPAHDIAAAQQVAAVGIGGIAMDDEHERLWLVNMADKKLYGINNVKPSTTPTAADVLGGYTIALPAGSACQGGELRPWGIKYHEGNVYVGAVCDAYGIYPGTDELKGYVLRFNPANTAAGFAIEHSFGFAAPRANYNVDVNYTWGGWQDYITSSPLISGIEFDVDGSLMLGIIDRSTMMTGTNNYNSLDCNDTNLSDITGAGDVLRFCKSNGAYIEGGTAGCATTIPDAVKTHDEYYWGDYGPLINEKIAFNETTQGGLTFVPGSNQLVSNGFDPAGFHEGGIFWLNNQTGGDSNRYFIYTTQTGIPTTPETMGKVSGLGDLEAITPTTPIEIGNRVWLDADNDGIQDAGENGIPNVQVKLFAGATELATATTAADGTYYFTNAAGTNTDSKKYGLDQLQPNTAYTVKFPTSVTVSGATYNLTTATAGGNIQIDSNAAATGDVVVTATDIPTAGANNHSFDVGYSAASTPSFPPPSGPSAFSCPTDVRLATSVQVNGDSQAAGSTGANVNGLITFDYAATGELAAPFSKATAGQVGSVWGLAYDNARKKLYASAFLKRHASFGPSGVGAIYQMDGASATPTPSLLIDLAAQGVDVGTSTRVAASGAVDNANELPIDASQPSWDKDAFAQVGKVSIGDIDISADGNTLWAINLKQRELVKVDLTTNTVTGKHAITDPGCSNGEFRPWALKVHDGKVWVGTVCSAETSQQASDLKAYVQAFDGSTFTTATSFALNYPKGSVGNGPSDEKWQPWTNTYKTLAANPSFAIYPQPILSDIEFDMDGSLILGFMDRMGHQVGSANYTPNHPDTTIVQGQTGGDIIRVCNNNGKYELENNATCASGSTDGKDKGQGPGNGEYYWGEMWDFNQWNADGGFHQETSFGGLAFKAGSGEIALTAMNPLNPNANAGGVIWLNNATGGRATNAGVQVYRQQGGTDPYFGKAAGMGDVELFCASNTPTCSINAPTVTSTCNNNGTPSNASDDKFTYKITATGSNVGATYSISGGDTYANRSYGTEHTSTNSFPISGGNLALTLTDDTTASCKLENVTITVPSTCSSSAPSADLEVTKTANVSSAKSGDTVIYTVKVKNNGPDTATGVEVSDHLPTGVTYASHNAGQGIYTSGTGLWTVGTLANGATATLTISVTIK